MDGGRQILPATRLSDYVLGTMASVIEATVHRVVNRVVEEVKDSFDVSDPSGQALADVKDLWLRKLRATGMLDNVVADNATVLRKLPAAGPDKSQQRGNREHAIFAGTLLPQGPAGAMTTGAEDDVVGADFYKDFIGRPNRAIKRASNPAPNFEIVRDQQEQR